MKVTITVTQEHVNKQKRGDCVECAFALAVNERLSEPYEANLFHNLRIEGRDGKPVYWLKLPLDVRAAIQCLDDQDDIGLPFTFSAIIPGKYLKPKEPDAKA